MEIMASSNKQKYRLPSIPTNEDRWINREAQAMKQTPMPAMAKASALRGVNFLTITLRRLFEKPWLVAFVELPCTALSIRKG
jgi:hypothetical protein